MIIADNTLLCAGPLLSAMPGLRAVGEPITAPTSGRSRSICGFGSAWDTRRAYEAQRQKKYAVGRRITGQIIDVSSGVEWRCCGSAIRADMLALQHSRLRQTWIAHRFKPGAPNGSSNRIQKVAGTGELTKYLTPARVLAPVMFEDDCVWDSCLESCSHRPNDDVLVPLDVDLDDRRPAVPTPFEKPLCRHHFGDDVSSALSHFMPAQVTKPRLWWRRKSGCPSIANRYGERHVSLVRTDRDIERFELFAGDQVRQAGSDGLGKVGLWLNCNDTNRRNCWIS